MNVLIITKRELEVFLSSPKAYVIGAVFFFVTGLFFFSTVALNNVATLSPVFKAAAACFLLIIPILTMHLMASEAQSGMLELLFTTPVRIWEVVVGKFLATFLFFLIVLGPTILYIIFLTYLDHLDIPLVVSGYVGILAFGAMLISIGVFASAATQSQFAAAGLTLFMSLTCWVLDWLGAALSGSLGNLFSSLSSQKHFLNFISGLVTINSIIYFLSITIAMLFMTTHMLEMRRWR